MGGFSMFTLILNKGPDCSMANYQVTPKEGIPVEKIFSIEAEKHCVDEDQPLIYGFFYKKEWEDPEMFQIASLPSKDLMERFMLPLNTKYLAVMVTDVLGA